MCLKESQRFVEDCRMVDGFIKDSQWFLLYLKVLSRIVNDFSNIRRFYRGKTKICIGFCVMVCVLFVY